jgi:hypothetical protein
MTLNENEEFVGPLQPEEKREKWFIKPTEETVEKQIDPYSNCDEIFTNRWHFRLTARQYAELVIRMKYDGLTRKQLGVGLLDLYLTNDEDFLKVLNKIKDRFPNKARKKRNRDKSVDQYVRERDNYNAELFGLKERVDNTNLYSISEKDMPTDLISPEEQQVIDEDQEKIAKQKEKMAKKRAKDRVNFRMSKENKKEI